MCQKQTYLETFINIEDAQWDKRKGGGNLGKKTFPFQRPLKVDYVTPMDTHTRNDPKRKLNKSTNKMGKYDRFVAADITGSI